MKVHLPTPCYFMIGMILNFANILKHVVQNQTIIIIIYLNACHIFDFQYLIVWLLIGAQRRPHSWSTIPIPLLINIISQNVRGLGRLAKHLLVKDFFRHRLLRYLLFIKIQISSTFLINLEIYMRDMPRLILLQPIGLFLHWHDHQLEQIALKGQVVYWGTFCLYNYLTFNIILYTYQACIKIIL